LGGWLVDIVFGLLNNSNDALSTHVHIFKHTLRQVRHTYKITSQRVEKLNYTLDAHVKSLGILTNQDIASTKKQPFEKLKHIFCAQSLNQNINVFEIDAGQIKGVVIHKVNFAIRIFRVQNDLDHWLLFPSLCAWQ